MPANPAGEFPASWLRSQFPTAVHRGDDVGEGADESRAVVADDGEDEVRVLTIVARDGPGCAGRAAACGIPVPSPVAPALARPGRAPLRAERRRKSRPRSGCTHPARMAGRRPRPLLSRCRLTRGCRARRASGSSTGNDSRHRGAAGGAEACAHGPRRDGFDPDSGSGDLATRQAGLGHRTTSRSIRSAAFSRRGDLRRRTGRDRLQRAGLLHSAPGACRATGEGDDGPTVRARDLSTGRKPPASSPGGGWALMRPPSRSAAASMPGALGAPSAVSQPMLALDTGSGVLSTADPSWIANT